ncbi:MAG: pectin acetylesterase-family hydrolase [Minicystis sp.]
MRNLIDSAAKRLAWAALLPMLLTGCSGGGDTDTGGGAGGDTTVDAGPAPLQGDLESWTWAPVDGAFCADGNPTGLAVNLTNRSPNAVIFLMGGGACWDYESCYGAHSKAFYVSRGFGESDMPFLSVFTGAMGLLSRDDPQNPFRDYSVVSIPYCTGDAFTGNNTAEYQGKRTMHVGHANIMAYLPRIVATFPNAQRIILVGASAGGVGVAYNWWHVQQAFGKIRVDMIDDSGDVVPAPYLKPSLLQTWQDAWHLEDGLPPGCTECKTALDALISWSAAQMPNSRGALLAFTQDNVFPGFLSITGGEFTMGLDALASQRLDDLPRFRYFFADQSGHGLMAHPDLTQNDVRLWDWLPQMVNDDPEWADVHP